MARKPKASFRAHLESVPRRCPPLRQDRRDGVLRLIVEVSYGGLLGIFQGIMQIKREKPYDLDGLALEVYDAIDGRRTIETLIDDFAARHHLTFFEGRALITRFLQMLEKRDLIEVDMPD